MPHQENAGGTLHKDQILNMPLGLSGMSETSSSIQNCLLSLLAAQTTLQTLLIQILTHFI